MPDQRCGGAQPLVVAGLQRQIGKQVPQVSPRVTQPARLGGEARQGLHHREGDQFRIAQQRADTHLGPPGRELRRFLQHVVGLHLKCGSEGVQVGVHEGLQVRRRIATPILGTLHRKPGRTRRSDPLELII